MYFPATSGNVMAQLDMATNMPIIGVYGKKREIVDRLRKRN